jgi:hypothetical protein
MQIQSGNTLRDETSEEIVERQQREAEWAAGADTRAALAAINNLEKAVTPRRFREAVLGTDGGWLADQEALIAAERLKL